MQAISIWSNSRDRELTARNLDYFLNTALGDLNVVEEAIYVQSIVPRAVIDAFVQRTNTCWDNYLIVIKGQYLDPQIDEATQSVRLCICRELKRLYDLNGSIPPGILSTWWTQYQCENVLSR
jgi:hypothetical protein